MEPEKQSNALALRGEGSVTLGGVEYKLKGTFEALINVEDALKTDLLSILTQVSKASLPLKTVATVFHELHKAAGGKLSFQECGLLLVKSGYIRNAATILNVLGTAVMAGREEADSSPS